MIDALIDKQDTFEIVRDQIAAILALEVDSQMALATAAGKDPNLWKLRIYSERANPLEEWRDPDPMSVDFDSSPIVNVRYDTGSFPMNKGNVVERQLHEGTFTLDCYGLGITADNASEGHDPGDENAALEAHRAVRLVRNILMANNKVDGVLAAPYVYLGLQGAVWRRWPQSITVFQPQIDSHPVQHIVGARLSLKVDFNEFSPQVTPETLDLLTVQVKRTEDGQIVLATNYDYT